MTRVNKILQWRQQEGKREGKSMTGSGMRPKYTEAQRVEPGERVWNHTNWVAIDF